MPAGSLWLAVSVFVSALIVLGETQGIANGRSSSCDAECQASAIEAAETSDMKVSLLQSRAPLVRNSGARDTTEEEALEQPSAERWYGWNVALNAIEETLETKLRLADEAIVNKTPAVDGSGCCPLPNGQRLGCCDNGGCCPIPGHASLKCCPATCASYGCGGSYVRGRRCQCNAACTAYGNCCSDYLATCGATPPPTQPQPVPFVPTTTEAPRAGAAVAFANLADYPGYAGMLKMGGHIAAAVEDDTKIHVRGGVIGAPPDSEGEVRVRSGHSCSDKTGEDSLVAHWKSDSFGFIDMNVTVDFNHQAAAWRTIVFTLPNGTEAACGALVDKEVGAAAMGPYPGFSGALRVEGEVLAAIDGFGLHLVGSLTGVPAFSEGGVHVHVGTSCDDARGHFIPGNMEDPWSTKWSSQQGGKWTLDLTIADWPWWASVTGHAVVVHLKNGTRAGCGLLAPPKPPMTMTAPTQEPTSADPVAPNAPAPAPEAPAPVIAPPAPGYGPPASLPEDLRQRHIQ